MADLGFDFTDEDYEQETAFEPPPTEDRDTHELAKEVDNNTVTAPEISESPPKEETDQSHSFSSLIKAMAEEDELEDEILTEENLSPVERIYAYKRDDIVIHRLLLAKELNIALEDMNPSEAIEIVVPIMENLAADVDDTVRETFAGELDRILLYFYKNTPSSFISNNNAPHDASFAPMLIRLLLDPTAGVASLSQQAIVTVTTTLNESSKSLPIYKEIIDSEFYNGVIEGLSLIVDGKCKSPRLDYKNELYQFLRVSVDENGPHGRRRSSTTPGFESSISMHHSPADSDHEQGESSVVKVTCISLIASISNVFGRQKCIDKCLPVVEKLASDSVFYVRKEVASAIGPLASILGTEIAEQRLLPLYRQFTEDQIWHVRRSAVLALPALCGVLPEDLKQEVAVTSVEIFHNDVSRNVRSTMADITGELIAQFLPPDWKETRSPGKVPEPLLLYFLTFGTNNNNTNAQMVKMETERAYICAYNFPAVVLTAGVEYWDSHFRDVYLNLTKDYQIKVRCTFAHSLHDIARIIGPERTERDLVQIFALYLMDLDDVKQGVLEHLSDFLGTLAVSSRNEYIPILAEVWDGVSTNWRLRNILAAQLRQIALLFDASRVVEHVLPLVVRACHDEFSSVRKTGIQGFPVVMDVVKQAVEEDGESLSQADGYGDDLAENKRNYALALLSHVMERLDEFARSDSYRGRLVFAQICQALIESGMSASNFASFFLPRLAPLAYDPVVNVRIAASRTVASIYTNESFRQELSEIAAPSRTVNERGESGHALDQMTYHFALDPDRDVRSFVLPFIDPIILEKQRAREIRTAEKALSGLNEKEIVDERRKDVDKIMNVDIHENERTTPMQDVETSSPIPPITNNGSISMELNRDKDSMDEDEIMADVDKVNTKKPGVPPSNPT
ncbi:armadillo-type protein [Pilobolus umbonatus]|nr:armadillo-type protein [Pilobolus umbonatus]